MSACPSTHRPSRALACALTAATLALPLAAQAGDFVLSAARVKDISGAQLELAGHWPVLGSAQLRPALGVFVHPRTDGRYSQQTQSNNTVVCRDMSNGQYADKENCDGVADVFASLELGAELGDRWALGAGVRVGRQALPYLALDLHPTPGQALLLRATAGKDLASLGLGWSF